MKGISNNYSNDKSHQTQNFELKSKETIKHSASLENNLFSQHHKLDNMECSERKINFNEILCNKNFHLTEFQVQKAIENRKSWPNFSEVFMISALKGIGVEYLKAYFISIAKKSNWVFNDNVSMFSFL